MLAPPIASSAASLLRLQKALNSEHQNASVMEGESREYLSDATESRISQYIREVFLASLRNPHSNEVFVSLIKTFSFSGLICHDLTQIIQSLIPESRDLRPQFFRFVRDLIASGLQISLSPILTGFDSSEFLFFSPIVDQKVREVLRAAYDSYHKGLPSSSELENNGWTIQKEVSALGYIRDFGLAIFNDDLTALISMGHDFDVNSHIGCLPTYNWRFQATPLDACAFFGSIRCFNYLRMNGADFGPHGFWFAAAGGNSEIIQAAANGGDPSFAIQASIEFCRVRVLEWLIDTYYSGLPTSEVIEAVLRKISETETLPMLLLVLESGWSLPHVERSTSLSAVDLQIVSSFVRNLIEKKGDDPDFLVFAADWLTWIPGCNEEASTLLKRATELGNNKGKLRLGRLIIHGIGGKLSDALVYGISCPMKISPKNGIFAFLIRYFANRDFIGEGFVKLSASSRFSSDEKEQYVIGQLTFFGNKHWMSKAGSKEWLQIDFNDNRVVIRDVVINMVRDGTPKAINVSVSADGENWVSQIAQTENKYPLVIGIEKPSVGRYLKFVAMDDPDGAKHRFGIQKVEIFGEIYSNGASIAI